MTAEQSSRPRAASAVRLIAFPAAALAALIGGIGAMVLAAWLGAGVWLVAVAGLLATSLLAGSTVRLALRSWVSSPVHPAWLAAGASVVCALCFWAVVLRAPGASAPAPTVAGERFWHLDTGSRIAYVRVPAPRGRHRTPIVYLHGGPGVSELPEVAPIIGRLARTGHEVYIYDQLGAGNSERLADPRGYTLQRDLADLEAIRRQIGANRVILIGHSWGASLAAAYLARHPRRVERVVFSSPGALDISDADESPVSRLSTGGRLAVYADAIVPRSLAGYLLAQVDPQTAHAFADDAEMDQRFAGLFARTRAGLFCDPALADRVSPDGVGFYAFTLTLGQSAPFNPRPILRKLHTPALILRGSCDYIPARVARQYQRNLSNSTLVTIRGAGHQAYLERTGTYLRLIRRFIAGEPPAADG